MIIGTYYKRLIKKFRYLIRCNFLKYSILKFLFILMISLPRTASTFLSFVLLQFIVCPWSNSSIYDEICNLFFENIVLTKTFIDPIDILRIFLFYLFPCLTTMLSIKGGCFFRQSFTNLQFYNFLVFSFPFNILCNILFDTIPIKLFVNPVDILWIYLFYLYPCFGIMFFTKL